MKLWVHTAILSIKTVFWAHEFQVPEKSYNIRPWSYIRDFSRTTWDGHHGLISGGSYAQEKPVALSPKRYYYASRNRFCNDYLWLKKAECHILTYIVSSPRNVLFLYFLPHQGSCVFTRWYWFLPRWKFSEMYIHVHVTCNKHEDWHNCKLQHCLYMSIPKNF